MRSDVYAEIGVSTEVMGATPHRQIQMLMEKCLQQYEAAKVAIATKDLAKKHKSIANALDIVIYLRACLNKSNPEAQQLTELLEGLYAFMEKNLVQANLRNDINYINEAQVVLLNLKEGWDGIA